MCTNGPQRVNNSIYYYEHFRYHMLYHMLNNSIDLLTKICDYRQQYCYICCYMPGPRILRNNVRAYSVSNYFCCNVLLALATLTLPLLYLLFIQKK